MKIELKNLKPNPFRNIGEYPINKEKVRGLKKSIEELTFWDNILARPAPGEKGKFEIAYGHHRLTALRELNGERSSKTVDIPIRDLDDATMIKIMANENAKDWAMDTAVITETIKAAESFLLLKKNLGRASGEWSKVTIARFLGGVFNEEMVGKALGILHAVQRGDVDEKAVKSIKEPTKAAEFVRAVKQAEKPVTVAEQRDMAKLIRTEKIATTEIKSTLRQWGHPAPKKESPPLWKFLNENGWKVEQLTKYLNELMKVQDELRGSEWNVFKRKCIALHDALSNLLEGKEVKTNGTKEKTASLVGANRRLLSRAE